MLDKIKNILGKISADALEYKGDDMIEDGLIDSLQLMEFVSDIEDEFEIEIEPEDFIPENFKTISDVEKLIKKYMNV